MFVDETGNNYGKYTVIARYYPENRRSRSAHWLCRCDCGKEKVVRSDTLRQGQAQSCGQCNRPSLVDRSGFSSHPLYHTWSSMIARCYNTNNPAFVDYGGRGIQVYQNWVDSPDRFFRWVESNLGPKLEGYSLDRIDVYGNYVPGNLRWATASEQVNNRRLLLLSEEEHNIILRLRNGDLNIVGDQLCARK